MTDADSAQHLRVVLHHDAGPTVVDHLDRLRGSGLDITWCPVDDRSRLRQLLRDADVLLHVLDPVTDELMAGAPRLRLIQKLGVGVNTIDLDAARRRSIAVANMPGINTPAVAEHSLLLMLAALRQVTSFDSDTRTGRGWVPDAARADRLGELGGRTVGLVGYGAVARRLEVALTALDARVIHWSRSSNGTTRRPFDTLLEESDIVSIHVPLTEDTRGLIDAPALGRMRRGAILINTARGPIVDQAALVAALREGHLAGAGLDVFEEEPVDPDDPILALANVVLTPHVAWLTVETMGRCLDVAAENCWRLAAGEELLSRVV
jgi:phosphoglycerate dehydrogenase-like enzyme